MNRLGPITAFVTTDSLSLHRCIPLGADDIARRCLGRRGRATASHVRPRRARERGAAIPLPRAQDSVARLALIEAAGFLVHQGPPAHPHGLALRDAHLTGSYTLTAAIDAVAQLAPLLTERLGISKPELRAMVGAFPGKDCVADFQDWQPVTAALKDHTVPVHGQDFGPEAYRN